MTGHSVVILNWHGIGPQPRPLDPGEDRTWVGVDAFERILDAIGDRPDVHITFDDGNASDVDIALPRLVERKLTAQFFVLAGELGRPGRLDQAAVGELCAAGMTIGSHGWAHRDWRGMRRDEVADELERAPRVLADISGQQVDRVAIPFGSYDRRVLGRLRRARVRRAYTSDGGRTRSDGWLQARTSVRHDTTAEHVTRLLDKAPSSAAIARRLAATWVKRNRPGRLIN